MAVEPAEDDVVQMTAITGLQRGDAIKWLKAYGNDANNATNAYLDNPAGQPSQAASSTWDENAFHSDTTEYGPQSQSQPSFSVHPPDTLNPGVFDGAISRPPSRVSIRGNDNAADNTAGLNKPLSLAEQDRVNMQTALAMSRGEALPSQEVGVTDASRPYFGPPTRTHYDDNTWTMTFAGHNAQEILVNPEPVDRKREPGFPAFIKPSLAKHYIPALVTILHAIPMAREALLARDHTLPEYGSGSDWWDGMPIEAPKVVDLEQQDQESDWEEIVFETQRLMAFLDQTDRAYGSTDVLANMEGVRQREDMEGGFLETWRGSILQASPHFALANVFRSIAVRNVPDEPEELKVDPFYCLDLNIYNELANTGQSLYEAFDEALWTGYNPTDPEEMYLDSVGEVFTMHITRSNEAETGLGIKIPNVWYADRYLKNSVKSTKQMRLGKATIRKRIEKIEQMKTKITQFRGLGSENKAVEGSNLLDISRSYFEQSVAKGTAVNGLNDTNGNGLSVPQSNVRAYAQVADELRAVAERVSRKFKALEESKEQSLEQLRELSRLYTQAGHNPDEGPHHRYTLRGVATNHRTTYVLEKTKPEEADNMLSTEAMDWQWWKINFSSGGAKPISYEKVREVEVLKAARDESRNVLLVYASDKAVSYKIGDLPPQLRNFVRADNLAFAAELEKHIMPKPTTPTKRKADDGYDDDIEEINWGGYQSTSPTKVTKPLTSATASNTEGPLPPPYSPSKPLPSLPRSTLSQTSPNKNRSRNVPSYDDTIPTSLVATGPTIDPASMALDDVDLHEGGRGGQEMQERNAGTGLLPGKRGYALGDYVPEIIMEDRDDEGKEKAD